MAPNVDPRAVETLNFAPGNVIQEFGWSEDVDDDLRVAIESATETELVDEDYDDVTDGVIVWWRDGDDDLTDLLVDVQTVLEQGGLIWLLSPKPGRSGQVPHSEIQEAATTAGLHATTTFPIAADWTATKLAARGRAR